MILDHQTKIDVPDEVLGKYRNECNRLGAIRSGLSFLHGQMARWEGHVGSLVDSEKVKFFSFGNDPLLKQFPMPLIECIFNWYAVSACNFVRLIGWIASQEGACSLTPTEYVESVIPEVKTFRDKVAAHFARTANIDGHADRQLSVFPQVGLSDGFFKVGIMNLATRSDGDVSTSSEMCWGITQTHLELAHRYWPGAAEGE